ncbi:MAG: transcription termination factor NusA [Ruminococcus sp.]|nr:transcription termination factor NusA [Ruminococcus sp.]
MDNSFFDALSSLGSEVAVEPDLLIEKVKSAMLKAAKKMYPNSEENIRIEIDPEQKIFEMYLSQTVVEDYPLNETEIDLTEAREIQPDTEPGDIIETRLDISKFGRAAAQSAKQSIKGDLRDITRERILSEFEDLENDNITVKVVRVEDGGTITVQYNNSTELYLFPNEQIPGEHLKEGQMIKVYITAIANKQKKPIIKISRARKELVARLFEKEIPEIYDGIVEIKSISREAGARSKVAVWSNNPNVEAVGACVGVKNSRIFAISKELNGEKIDIVPYSESVEEFIANALLPAKVIHVDVLSNTADDRSCTVVVPNNQLSLAIGNRGQNAKLAVKLTGFKIDIRPEFEIPHPEVKGAAQEKIQTDKDTSASKTEATSISSEIVTESEE